MDNRWLALLSDSLAPQITQNQCSFGLFQSEGKGPKMAKNQKGPKMNVEWQNWQHWGQSSVEICRSFLTSVWWMSGLMFWPFLQTMREPSDRRESSSCPCGHLTPYRRLTSVKIPLMNISPYRTDANLSNLIDSTVVITCTQKLAPTMWTRSKLRLFFIQACQMAACQNQEMQMHIFTNKKTNTNIMEGGYWMLRCRVRYKWPSRRCHVMAAITSSRSRCRLPTQI